MDKLRNTLRKTGLHENDIDTVCSQFREKHYEKDEYLLMPGQIATKIYFIEKGSVILGQETENASITRHLAVENEFISCLESFTRQIVTNEFLKATGPSHIYELGKPDFEAALRAYPPINQFYQQFIFDTLLKCQQRIVDLIGKDSKTYYQDIMLNRPDYIQKMRQYDLASYMGIEPQSLSRLRTSRKTD